MHTFRQRGWGVGDNLNRKCSEDVWLLSTPSAPSSLLLGRLFDVLFREVESHGLCIFILRQIKICPVRRQSLLCCIQMCLKHLISLFFFTLSREATVHLF